MENMLKNNSAIKACEELYLNEEFADVHFVFGVDDEIEKVPANKANLAVLSPVFKTMFYGSLPEKGDVQITDSDADGFKEFLQFFYLSNVKLTMENIETVVRLADKYDVREFVTACATFLKVQLTIENMCWGYQLALFLENDELIEFCEDKIIQSPKEIFATDLFQRCDKTILTRIMDLNLMCMEFNVFDACLMWAKNACEKEGLDSTQSINLRNKLGNCLKLIRFGAMKVDEFKQRYMEHKGLFTLEEFEDIIFSITVKEYVPTLFNKKPRSVYSHTWDAGKMLRCQRLRDAEMVKYIKTSEVTSFSSNHIVFLGEIRTAPTYIDLTTIKSSEIEVIITEHENLKFKSKDRPKIVYKSKSGIWEEDHLKMILSQPIVIYPQKMYEIRLNIQSPGQSFYYSDCEQMVEMKDGIIIQFHRNPTLNYEMEDGIKIQFHRNPTLNYDNLSNGLISDLFFNKFSTNVKKIKN